MREIKSLIELMSTLHDKNSCREFLEQYRWQGVPVCPHCKHKSEHHYKLKNKGEFDGLYKCRHCKKRFTVTVGTMFEGAKYLWRNGSMLFTSSYLIRKVSVAYNYQET